MNEFLTELLIAVIAAAVPVLTAYGVSLLKKIAAKAEASTDDIKVKGYIKEIAEAISDAVAATSQTYVDALKQAGEFTKEAQAEAAKKALTACMASISPAAQRFIEAAYGDLKEYLANKIEAEVRKQKISFAEPLTAVMETTTDTTAVAASTAAATAATIAQTAIQQINAEAAQAEQQA